MSTIHNKQIVAKEYPLKDILSNNKYSIDYFKWKYEWGFRRGAVAVVQKQV